MGLCDCCTNLRENIRESPPAQLALSFAGGIILMTLLLAISGTLNLHNSCPGCAASTYLSFALNSQQAVCKLALESSPKTKVCSEHLLKNLTIHGLWPTLSKWRPRAGLSDCTDKQEPFSLAVLTDDDRKRMAARWSSVFKESGNQAVNDTTFWRHEWDRHGSCSQYTVKEYFEATLVLDERYPVNRWLAEAAITPNNSRAYSLGELTTAMERHLPKASFYLQCVPLKNARKAIEQLWLYQVVLCVAWADGRSLIQCPQRPPAESCSEPFYFVEDYMKL